MPTLETREICDPASGCHTAYADGTNHKVNATAKLTLTRTWEDSNRWSLTGRIQGDAYHTLLWVADGHDYVLNGSLYREDDWQYNMRGRPAGAMEWYPRAPVSSAGNSGKTSCSASATLSLDAVPINSGQYRWVWYYKRTRSTDDTRYSDEVIANSDFIINSKARPIDAGLYFYFDGVLNVDQAMTIAWPVLDAAGGQPTDEVPGFGITRLCYQSDVAVNLGKGRVYAFKRDDDGVFTSYQGHDLKLRCDHEGNGGVDVDLGSSGTGSLESGFPGLKAAGFDSFDNAVNLGNGKVCFLSGEDCLFFDIAANRADAGYPKPIREVFPGVEALLNADGPIDAVFALGKGKVYFCKYTSCVCFDLAAKRVDAGYPKPLAEAFPALGPAFKMFPKLRQVLLV